MSHVSLRQLAVLLAVFLLRLSPLPAQAASATDIRGRVVHATSDSPIASATIDVVSVATGAAMGRVASSTDGTFRLRGLPLGEYRVTVRAFGVAPRMLPSVMLTATQPTVDVGTIGLTEVALQLEKQAITADREAVQIQPDRTSYVVRDMPTTKGGTALDVLRNVPSVDVDIDNNLSLRGDQGVIIQINGRPSALKGAQLGNFLDQLSADAIDHVEIVPNPSAREDADGVAGIINIVLRQKADGSSSGGLTLGAGTRGAIDAGLNGGWQRGPLSLFGDYALRRDNKPRYDDIFRENLAGASRSYLQETGLRTQIPLVHTVTGSATFQPSDHDELSVDGLFSQRREWETRGITYQTLDTTFTMTDLTERHGRDVNHEGSTEAALSYKHDFAAKGHKFSSELRYEGDYEGGPTDLVDQSRWPMTAPATTTLQQTLTLWTHERTVSLKADYARPFAGMFRMEAGYKGTLGRIHSTQDVQVYNATAGAMQPDSAQMSNFSYDQGVHDVYAMLIGAAGRFQFQGGVRAEHAGTTFDLHARDQRLENPYNSLFPSGLVSFAVNDAQQVKLAYSTRIRRSDDPDELDPTPRMQDARNISVGNPRLQPAYVRAFELGYQRTANRVTVQVTPFYRHSFNAVSSIRTVDTAGVTTETYANIATTDAYGTDATVSLGSGRRLSGFVGGTAYHQKNNADNLDPRLSARTYGWSIRTNAAWRVSRTLDAQAVASYTGRTTVVGGWNAARTKVSLGVRQKLMADQLSLTLRVIDPFSTARERSATLDPSFTQVNSRIKPIRAMQLTAAWMFGRAKKGSDEINLENGGG